MAEALGWPLKAFREAFREAFSEGLVKADWNARVVWIPGAISYNPPQSPNVVKSWAVAWDEIPECALKVEAYQGIKAFLEGFSQGYLNAFIKACVKPMPNQEQEQEQDKEEEVFPSEISQHGSESPQTDPPTPPDPSAANGTGNRVDPALSDVDDLRAKRLAEAYNACATRYGLPTVTMPLNAKRLAKARTRLKEHPGRKWWAQVWDAVADQPFLRGENDRGWRLSFDFLIANAGNAERVLERQFGDDSAGKRKFVY